MSVWLTIPSKRPPEEAEPVLKQWRERGYKIALWKDGPGPEFEDADGCNLLIQHPIYPGYAVAANRLIAMVAERHPDAEYFVCGGDDVLPDPNHTAEEIAAECNKTFMVRGEVHLATKALPDELAAFGVMQPTGDRWGLDPNTHTFVSIAANRLIAMVAERHPDAEYFVCGGDDVLPDPNHTAEEIAAECSKTFMVRGEPRLAFGALPDGLATFGVMQPTGDRWGLDPNTHTFVSKTAGCGACACQICGRGEIAPVHLTGAYSDRVAGSPWIGREFARRMYQGQGPYWPEYTHMGVDEELQAVATKLGVFWQRPDLTHFHQHWGRPKPGETMGQSERMPAFLAKANSGEEWKRYKRIFAERQAAGFPGSDPI